MELWTFRRFKHPELCVDEIACDVDRHAVCLRQGDHSYWLRFDAAEAALQVAEELSTLRRSDAALWSTLRESSSADAWGAVGEFLDSHSLIREARGEGWSAVDAVVETMDAYIDDVVDRLFDGRSSAESARIRSDALTVVETAFDTGTQARSSVFDPACQPNFFRALLACQLEYFRRECPLTLITARVLLRRIANGGKREPPLTRSPELLEACTLYDVKDARSHLWGVSRLLASASANGCERLPTPVLPEPLPRSGIEFMRQIEVLTRTALRDWGKNSYVTALDELGDRYAPLIAGPFIEQYHVTRRFVEMIAPLLSKRLSPALRAMMFRYYSEEVGHEALESTTCNALGVAEEDFGRISPLPLHFAFVDMLEFLAVIDPMSSFASIMVIEGVFGEPPKMSLRLAAVARTNPAFREIAGDHEELNESLNHNSISRDAFENIPWVAPETQARVVHRVLFLLELNHRAWGEITDFYGRQATLRLHGLLGETFDAGGHRC